MRKNPKNSNCNECNISFENEKTYNSHCLDLHSTIELFSSDETSKSSLSKSRKLKKSDNVNLVKNLKNMKRKRSNDSNIASECKKRKEDLDLSELDVELIHEIPNMKPMVMECRDCKVIFENEFEQKTHIITEHLQTKVSGLRDESIERQIKQELISIGSNDLPEGQQILMTYKDAHNVTNLINEDQAPLTKVPNEVTQLSVSPKST